MTGDPPQFSQFYRGWSARAARLALATIEPQAKLHCARCAGMWALIADTIESGDEDCFSRLTNNLACLTREGPMARM